MTDDTDLFDNATAQASLFGPGENRMQPAQRSTTPDPNVIRLRLHSLLEKARRAQAMPWPEREARMWQTVFPNMARWLPPEEGEQLKFEFAQEMRRLAKAA
jgi:hypothetical protein